MSAKPNIYLEWCTTYSENPLVVNGATFSMPNRAAIPTSFSDTGVLINEPVPRQYLNQSLYLTAAWLKHLDQRYAVGDVIFTVSTEDAATISVRLGGTWIQRGTQNIGTIVGAKVWEKTA